MLYAFGDSYTFGQGLPDIGEHFCGGPDVASKQTWPTHLAKLLGTDVENHSHGGASMLHITKLFLDVYHKIQPGDIVVVAWTYFDRWSIINPDLDSIKIINLLPNMPRGEGQPIYEEYLPFTNNQHKIEMFCMLSTLIASLCELKGVKLYQRALDRMDLRDLKKYKPDWYDLYIPHTGMLVVNARKKRIEKATGLKIDRLPDLHNNQDTHIWWALCLHRQITRSLSA